MIARQVVTNNRSGLHARPAAVFVQNAGKFKSAITIKHQEKTINGKSILSVLAGGLSCGAAIELLVDGEDEQAAADALMQLFAAGLGE